MTATNTLIIGCGNLLCGDDAVGPMVVRRLEERGLPAGVRCIDAGTGGIDVALWMRGVPEAILVDACLSGAEPGSLIEVPAADLDNLPPPSGIALHAIRWNHAVAFGRQLLAADFPPRVTVFLVEGQSFEPGAGLSPAVCQAVESLAQLLLARCGDHDLASR